jgi:hypothetical protein
MRASLLSLVVIPFLFLSGCKPDLIPGTQVEDTEENRKVLEFLAKYRKAIVERSTDGVVGLVAKDYFEDNGTVEQEDDYGVDGLRQKLTTNFEKTKEIQLEIIVQQIERPEGDEGPIKIAYRYNQRALVAFPAGEKWLTISDVNRIVLRPDDTAGYLIISGL